MVYNACVSRTVWTVTLKSDIRDAVFEKLELDCHGCVAKIHVDSLRDASIYLYNLGLDIPIMAHISFIGRLFST